MDMEEATCIIFPQHITDKQVHLLCEREAICQIHGFFEANRGK